MFKRTFVTPEVKEDRSELILTWIGGVFIVGILAACAGLYVYNLFT